MRTNPNQKTITVNKIKCDKNNLYMMTNLKALQYAAQDLKAGAFKLWIYFSQNQNGYSFALSNKDVNDSFGIKKDQYDSAIKELEVKGYLINNGGNNWIFTEIPNSVVGKNHNENLEVGKNHNETAFLKESQFSLQEKTTTQKWEKTTTRCGKKPQEILQDNTIKDNTLADLFASKTEKGSLTDPIPVTANELNTFGISAINLVSTPNGLLRYQDKYLKPVQEIFSF